MKNQSLALSMIALSGVLAVAACGSDNGHEPMAKSTVTSAASPSGHMPGMDHDMAGMAHGAMGDGLAATKDGYALKVTTPTLPAGQATNATFSITAPDGKPLTQFVSGQTKLLHFYAIRTDLTGFQHLHPTMAADGTWTAPLAALAPGNWRLYTSFIPGAGAGKNSDFVLSQLISVPGTPALVPLPAPAATANVDGYTVTVKGEPMAGMMHPLTVSVSKGGQPVTTLEPYLQTYAHLTAFNSEDGAFAHLHPTTDASAGTGGPDLTFDAELPKAGQWRVFVQFQTGGVLHTAALTLAVR
jgi:hypothetical protein